MLKLQYDYALKNTGNDGQVEKDGKQTVVEHDFEGTDRRTKGPLASGPVTTTGSAPYLPIYGELALAHSQSGQLERLWPQAPTHSTIWMPPRLGWGRPTEPTMSGYGHRDPTYDVNWTPQRLGKPDLALTKMEKQKYLPFSASAPIPYREAIQHSIPNVINPSVRSTLHSNFKLRPDKFFKVGRVLMVLWAEPVNPSGNSIPLYSFPVAYGERALAKIRRFIVVKKDHGHVLAVPIFSYQGRGIASRDHAIDDHAIVYMGASVPRPRLGERTILSPGIRVIPDDPTDRLKDTSRIHFGKTYTIETNLRCKTVGFVHESCLHLLSEYHENAVLGREHSSQGLAIISEEGGVSVDKKSHSTSGTEPDTGNQGTEGSTENQPVHSGIPAAALRSLNPRKHSGQGSDSGYGNSRAATEARSVAPSTIDEIFAERMEADDDLGPGRILTYVDAQELEVPVFDPDNPSSEQLQALSDSSLQFLLDSLLAEQQRRMPLGSTQG